MNPYWPQVCKFDTSSGRIRTVHKHYYTLHPDNQFFTLGTKIQQTKMLVTLGLVICFYLGWSGSTLPIRTNVIKVVQIHGYLLAAVRLPSYIGSNW